PPCRRSKPEPEPEPPYAEPPYAGPPYAGPPEPLYTGPPDRGTPGRPAGALIGAINAVPVVVDGSRSRLDEPRPGLPERRCVIGVWDRSPSRSIRLSSGSWPPMTFSGALLPWEK